MCIANTKAAQLMKAKTSAEGHEKLKKKSVQRLHTGKTHMQYLYKQII